MSAQYVSFLLRLWRERPTHEQDTESTPCDWQGELENVQSGDMRDFGSLDELFSLLQDLTAMDIRRG
jgi:hypothetical protein